MKIAMDTTYAGRMYLCRGTEGRRFTWSKRRAPLEFSEADALDLAKVTKLVVREFDRLGGEVTCIVALDDGQKEKIGVGIVNFGGCGDGFNDPLLTGSGCKDFVLGGNAHAGSPVKTATVAGA